MGCRVRRYSSSGSRNPKTSKAATQFERTRGGCEISGSKSTLRLGVKGSGSRIDRGNADRKRFLSWMHDVGIRSQKLWWKSLKNSGKSCSSTSRTRSVPLYSVRMASVSSTRRRYGSRNTNRSTSKRCTRTQPFWFLIRSTFGRNMRCDTSSSHENAKPGTTAGCSAWKAVANAARTRGFDESRIGSGAFRSCSRSTKIRKNGRCSKRDRFCCCCCCCEDDDRGVSTPEEDAAWCWPPPASCPPSAIAPDAAAGAKAVSYSASSVDVSVVRTRFRSATRAAWGFSPGAAVTPYLTSKTSSLA
mmetsp:Transcript_26609/g.81777  ORF Transcript_26609/g.81777 Transcript_26609/m.81777 type:complete len:302 (-) Transcript_26609:107-1012(-)